MKLVLGILGICLLVFTLSCHPSAPKGDGNLASNDSLAHIWDTIQGTIIATIEWDDQNHKQKLRIWAGFNNGKYYRLSSGLGENYFYSGDTVKNNIVNLEDSLLYSKFNKYEIYRLGVPAGNAEVSGTVFSQSCDASICGKIKQFHIPGINAEDPQYTFIGLCGKKKSTFDNISAIQPLDSGVYASFLPQLRHIGKNLMDQNKKEEYEYQSLKIDSSKISFSVKMANLDADKKPEYIAEGYLDVDSEHSYHCLLMYHTPGFGIDTFYHDVSLEKTDGDFTFELIDALDIDGDGNKELVFSYLGPGGMVYVIYSYEKGVLIRKFSTEAWGC